MNWTEAVEDPALAKICTLNQLREAQRELLSNATYWIALKRVSEGMYQWGNVKNNTFFMARTDFVKESQDGLCYVVDKHLMKLHPSRCSSFHYSLHTFEDDKGG